MKKSILLIIGCFLGLNWLSAQVTYPSSDFATPGDTFVLSRVTAGLLGLDFAQTGANFTWNYDSLEINNQSVQRYLEPNNAGYFFAWNAGCL